MWKEKTYWRGGGDIPHKDERYYVYSFSEKWWDKLLPYRVKFRKEFTTREVNTNGCSMGHRVVLEDPDFLVNGMNVVEWARNVVSRGRVELVFLIDKGDPYHNPDRFGPPKLFLTAKFSDKGLASLFKLTFG